MSTALCTHFNKLKPEKIAQLANAVKRPDFCQSQAHQAKSATAGETRSSEIWVCLDCGNQACSKYSSSVCAQKHYVEQKHRLAISLSKLIVYCFECDDDLQSILSEYELNTNNPNKNAMQKVETFMDKVKQSFYKISQTVAAQKKSTQSTQHSQMQSQASGLVSNNNNVETPKLKAHPPQVFGLQNIGNTCFFNSVLQCLNGTAILEREYVSCPTYDFQEPIDMWDELGADEFESIVSVKSNEEDEWCSIKDKKKEKREQKESVEKFTGLPLKKTNQLFQQFLIDARGSKSRTLNPIALFKAISQRFARFKTFEQQDAYDLLRCFLDSLIVGEEKWQKVNKSAERTQGKLRNTITESTFGGYLTNYLKCLQCDHVSRSFEFFLDLALPVAPKTAPVKRVFAPLDILGDTPTAVETKTTQPVSSVVASEEEVVAAAPLYKKVDAIELKGCRVPYLNDDKKSQQLWEPTQYTSGVDAKSHQPRKLETLFDEFFNFEALNSTNNYKCEKCGKTQKSLKKFYLYEPPQVLTLVLKRFVQTGRSTFEKLNTHVEVPNILNIDPYTIVKGEEGDIETAFTPKFRKNANYELYGIVSHSGSMNQGHYISFVKHIVDKQPHWFYYSDTDVYETSWENVKTAQPYILFYKRVL